MPPANDLPRYRRGIKRASGISSHAAEAQYLKTKAVDVEATIRTELGKHVFDSEHGFIDRVFSEVQRVDDILNACNTKGLYAGGEGGGGGWTDYPAHPPQKESPLYAPFVEIATQITQIARKLAKDNDEPVNNVQWLDQHSHTPPKSDANAADLRPDIAVAIGDIPDKKTAPWRRILAPLEVKKDDNDKPALLQLLMYQRQIFREAVDRRFVIGFTLAYKKMRVYLADRSGVLGSEVFDIDAEPRKLITVVAAMETLPLYRLGWDTSMRTLAEGKVDSKDDPQSLPLSYELPFRGLVMDHHFVIDMPLPKSSSNPDPGSQSFVLYESLSLQRGEYVTGRATRIWKAWLWSDKDQPREERHVYIVKDTWRDAQRGLEGEVYEQLDGCEGIAVMHSYGSVKIESQEDTTLSFIRRGLSAIGNHIQVDTVQRKVEEARSAVPITSPDQRHDTTRYIVDDEDLPQAMDEEGCPPRERVHSRLVMKTYGWPAKYARSPVELATAMRDAIKGHHEAYKKGVLHGDISPENLLILVNGHGILIDFDNAIIRSTHEVIPQDPLTGTLPFVSAELLTERYYFKRKPKPAQGTVRDIPVHDFIHDLESFCWVLVWICLTRDGPARRRRDMYSKEETWELNELRRDIKSLFEDNRTGVAAAKRTIMLEVAFEYTTLADHVSEFFSPLKPLITDFLDILVKAYREHSTDSDGIYQSVYEAFDRCITHMKAHPVELSAVYKSLQRAETERRMADRGANWDQSPQMVRTLQPPPKEVDPVYDPPSSPTLVLKKPRLDPPSSPSEELRKINELPSESKGKLKSSRR